MQVLRLPPPLLGLRAWYNMQFEVPGAHLSYKYINLKSGRHPHSWLLYS